MFQPFNFGKIVLVFASFVILSAFNTISINAQSVCLLEGQTKTFTYTSSFGSAGSAKATFTRTGNTIVVNYKNTSTSNTYLSGIGFNTAPRTAPESLATATATNGWMAVAGPGGGLGNYDLTAYGNGRNRLSPESWGIATFILTQVPQEGVCLNTSIVHLTSLPNGNSEKPVGVLVPDNPDSTGSTGGSGGSSTGGGGSNTGGGGGDVIIVF